MLIERKIEKELKEMALQYPVVTITGPRQSGKTTLAKMTFPGYAYFSLENPDTREQVQGDPKAFLYANPKGVIIDEFQHFPEILSYIQGVVDKSKEKGIFILTGSNQLSVLRKVNQSLAGRTALLKLLPFSISEIKSEIKDLTVNRIIMEGFYPGVFSNRLNPYKAYRNYYETYIERDVRQISNIQNLRQFQLFIRLCAGRIGQLFNASALSNEIGVSNQAIKHWLSILEASYIVYILPPWHANLKKRLVKSPKIYFYDVGLASFLLGIENEKHLEMHPLRGALFENMVLLELVKNRFNSGLDSNFYFYRDNHNNEVDVVQEQGHHLNLFEIKSSMTFHSGFLKGLNYLNKILPDRIDQSTLVYSGTDDFILQNHKVINFFRVVE
ncbi:MAG: ATP-binding protein [Prolixibacteraceae bacterium]|nr:ATP-binding protein [Prolixibacteraceae bacterium]